MTSKPYRGSRGGRGRSGGHGGRGFGRTSFNKKTTKKTSHEIRSTQMKYSMINKNNLYLDYSQLKYSSTIILQLYQY